VADKHERDPAERPAEGRKDLQNANARSGREEDRSFTHGTSGATADAAVCAGPTARDRNPDSPHSRAAEPLRDDEKPDQLARKKEACEDEQDALLDEGVEETFPASDPVSVKRIT
jgi:hypothetical protein